MIVDSHVHLLPGRLGEAVRDFFDRYIPGMLVYPNDHAAVLAALGAAGVGEVWNLPYAHKPGVAAGLNAASAALAREPPHPRVRVVGGATVHPGDAEPERLLAAALDELGLRVLKLHCAVGGFTPDDARLDRLWELVERRRVPTVIHAGHHVSGATEAHELEPIARVAERYPGAPLIIAHCGQPDTGAALALVARHANIHADLTPRVIDAVAVADADLETWHARILFGTDAPNTGLTVEACLARLDGLSAAARAAILGDNARRLVAAVTT